MFVYWYIIVFICPEHTIVTYKYTYSFIPLNKGTSSFFFFNWNFKKISFWFEQDITFIVDFGARFFMVFNFFL